MRTYKRVIYSDETVRTRVNDAFEVSVRYIVTGLKQSETSKTDRIDRVLVYAYVNGSPKFRGQECRFTGKSDGRHYQRKPLSVPKDRTRALHKIKDTFDLDRLKTDAFKEAIGEYIGSLRDLKATVVYFDKSSGEGMVKIDSLGTTFQVYACNIKGKKTWYPSSACMYLVRDETVLVSEIHPQCGAIINNNINTYFDKEKWESLDQSKLAFKCDDDGNAINGLFA